jgi:hypothetical protein
MKSCMKTLPLIVLLSAVLLSGCGKDEATGPAMPSDALGWINLAWSQYEAGDYGNSGASFNSAYFVAINDSLLAYQDSVSAALNHDPLARQEAMSRLGAARMHLLQIFTGGGWVGLKLSSLNGSNSNFLTAVNMISDYPDAIGGHAFALQAIEYWVQSNEKVATTLSLDPLWEFTHETQINYLDLRLLRAENYFNLEKFELSLTEALTLNAIVNPGSPLTANNFNLATIEGRMALQQLIYTLDDHI